MIRLPGATCGDRAALPMPVDAAGKPRKIDSCYAYASDRVVVQRRWPRYYDGPAAASGHGGLESPGNETS